MAVVPSLSAHGASSVSGGWGLVSLVALGWLGAASGFSPVTLVALTITGLAVAGAAMCTPPGEKVMRSSGIVVWLRHVCLLAAALVAAAGVAVSTGATVLALWTAVVVAVWLWGGPGAAAPSTAPSVPLDDRTGG